MQQLQQGDVLLLAAQLPEGCKKISAGRRGYVLVEGESTGHAHVIEDIEGCEIYEKDGVMYISASREVSLTHEEHNVVKIPAGSWEVGIVQEYDPFDEELRNVRD